ncbi:hypothetical protein ACM26V_05145 [Salipaludibacillus sp. HK11]|uniref:hypothetical protein n=1 Tax=Salipaludibacillus sp. HK11 TaxID=3394320 RepID=UPI0039FC13C3
MNIRVLGVGVVSVLLMVLAFLYISERQNRPTSDDLFLEATLKYNENEKINREYVMEIFIDKEMYESGSLFPFIQGKMATIEFDPSQEEGFYKPDNLGVHGEEERLLEIEFQEKGLLDDSDGESYNFTGIFIPIKADEYRMEVYMDVAEGLNSEDPVYLSYVYRGFEIFGVNLGLDAGWVKTIEVDLEFD